MGRVKLVNRVVRDYDRCLYASQPKPSGAIHVFRKSRDASEPPHFIFALTDNWQANGKPVEYGLDVVLARVKACDLWRDDKLVEYLIQAKEDKTASMERERKNTVESFLYEFRSQFARTFNDVNTSNLEKIDIRRNQTNG